MEKRLDIAIVEDFNVSSRTKAQNLIESGSVLVNCRVITKVSFKICETDIVEILEHDDYVSRGAYKLLGAIKSFNLNFKDRVVLDIGASTGGFTEVALKNGAKKVYALDVGREQLDKSLLNDKRVISIEGRDIRELKKEEVSDVNFIIGDLSFISLTKVLPYIKNLFDDKKEMMFLFKPQFECGREIAKKYKGIIKNSEIHVKLLENFVNFVKLLGFSLSNIDFSPIKGGDGNIEYLIYFNGEDKVFNIKDIVFNAFKN